jgi:hypothetical protein
MSVDQAAAPGTRLPRRRRFLLLVVLSAAGALAFVPFLLAQAGAPASPDQVTGFVVVTTSLAVAASWFGLGWADRLGLPLPLLRAWERGAPLRLERRALLISLAAGLVFGAIGLATLSSVGMSGGLGSFAVRAASTGFAAITLEVILHLGLMSGVAVLLRGRVRAAIAVTAALFVAFHLSDTGSQPLDIALLGAAVNGLGGLVFGWLYATRGFEYLVLAHAVAHLVTVGLGGG